MARVRHSLEWLQQQYDAPIGNRKPLETVVRAWKGIQDKSKANPNDPDGFFVIGGYHGEPFHGAGQQSSDSGYWGGYCNHGNVLFPTWHRAYLWRLEDAMRKIPGCEDVTLPFWDEMLYYTGTPGQKGPDKVIPSVLTNETFPLDGEDIPNPLRSYTFPRQLADAGDAQNVYDKHKNYETVRFPYSGLVGTEKAREATKEWNAQYSTATATDALNLNVSTWLNEGVKIPKSVKDPKVRFPDTYSVGARYKACLNAPNYMVFSNKSSAAQYMTDHDIEAKDHIVVSLEDPHNAIHLSLGGIYQFSNYRANPKGYDDANGDMGENNTAGLDPIFFFHHAFIDYTFWTWQKKNSLTKRGDLTVEWGYAGTNSSDGSGAPAFQVANASIDMETPLYPFRKSNGKSWYTSHDVTDIEELGYTYATGSLDPATENFGKFMDDYEPPAQVLRIAGINRLKHEGSFVIRTKVVIDGEEYEVGRDPILSRYKVQGCRNCQNHLEVKSYVPVQKDFLEALGTDLNDEKVKIKVDIQSHSSGRGTGTFAAFASDNTSPSQPTIEIL